MTLSGLATAIQGQEHLNWASHRFARPEQEWINPLALIEFTLDFFRFFLAEVLPRSGAEGYQWRVGMINVLEPSPLCLPTELEVFAKAQPPTEDRFFTAWMQSTERRAGVTAYKALTEVYARFGFDPAVMPYSEDGAVGEEAIQNVHR